MIVHIAQARLIVHRCQNLWLSVAAPSSLSRKARKRASLSVSSPPLAVLFFTLPAGDIEVPVWRTVFYTTPGVGRTLSRQPDTSDSRIL